MNNFITLPITNYQLLIEDKEYEFEVPAQPAINAIRLKLTDECKNKILLALESIKRFDSELLYPQFNFDYPHDIEMAIMQDDIQLFGVQDGDGVILTKLDGGETDLLDIYPLFISRLVIGVRIIKKSINLQITLLTDDEEELLWELTGSKFIEETIF